MKNPRLPVIRKVLNNKTGEIKWQALEPIQYWGTGWAMPQRVPYRLMMLARIYVQKLNEQHNKQD